MNDAVIRCVVPFLKAIENREIAELLAVALQRQTRVLEAQCLTVPDPLEDLKWAVVEVAKAADDHQSGHEGSPRVTRRAPVDDADMSAWMSPSRAAAYAGVSVSTIKRRIRDRSLPSTKTAGCRRIRRTDLDRFLEA